MTRPKLINLPNWVCWRREKRKGEQTKVPYRAKTHREASSTDPTTWATLDEARAALERKQGIYDGLGFMLGTKENPSGVVLIDFDHCRDPKTEIIEDWAMARLRVLDTLTHVSPSGEGVHALCWGEKPGDSCVRNRPAGSTHPKAKIEMYAWARFATVTDGSAMIFVDGFPSQVQERGHEVREIYADLWPTWKGGPSPARNHMTKGAVFSGDDEAVLATAFRARYSDKFTKLWTGDYAAAEHPSPSEAVWDLLNRLAFFSGPNPARIDRLFRRSGLFSLDGQAEKWERLGPSEIAKVLDGMTVYYVPGEVGADGFRLTDAGNGERLAAWYGDDLRYVRGPGWLVWDGMHWKPGWEPVIQKAKLCSRQILARAAATEEDHRRDALRKWATTSEEAWRLRAMVELARSESPIYLDSADLLDADPWLLNARNGSIDLRTGMLRNHRREDLLTRVTAVDYRPDALPQRWSAFLDTVMSGDQEMVGYLQRVSGSALIGKVLDHAIFILHGPGFNGKGVFLEVQRQLLGSYALTAASDLLLAREQGRAHPTSVADLWGARMVCCSESDEESRLAEALVKRLTGGNRLSARRMRQDPFEFTPSHTLFLETNHKPSVQGQDHAIWARIHAIPFDVIIAEEAQDKELADRLVREEGSAILGWMVEGCLAYQREGLQAPEVVRLATRSYRDQQRNSVGTFVRDSCANEPGMEVSASLLYRRYQVWAPDSKLTQTAFGRSMADLGYERIHRKAGDRWIGISLSPGLIGAEG